MCSGLPGHLPAKYFLGTKWAKQPTASFCFCASSESGPVEGHWRVQAACWRAPKAGRGAVRAQFALQRPFHSASPECSWWCMHPCVCLHPSTFCTLPSSHLLLHYRNWVFFNLVAPALSLRPVTSANIYQMNSLIPAVLFY